MLHCLPMCLVYSTMDFNGGEGSLRCMTSILKHAECSSVVQGIPAKAQGPQHLLTSASPYRALSALQIKPYIYPILLRNKNQHKLYSFCNYSTCNISSCINPQLCIIVSDRPLLATYKCDTLSVRGNTFYFHSLGMTMPS